MLDTDKNQFKTLMLGAGEVYGKEINKPLLQTYFAALSTFEMEEVSAAMTAHLVDPDQGTFFPKPADLVRQIKGTSRDQKRSIESRAELAWNQIYHHITVKGPYKQLKLDDLQALAAVKAIGGMSVLSTADNEKMTWLKKEFISNYDTYENTPLEQLPSSLPGLVELQQHKIDQKQGLNSVLSIANEMIEKEKIVEPEKPTREQSLTNAQAIRAELGMSITPDDKKKKRIEEMKKQAEDKRKKDEFHKKMRGC